MMGLAGSGMCAVPQSGSVAVTVTDADENPLAAREVAVYANDQDTGKRGITGEDGVVSFELLEGDYRFRVEDGGQSFWNSGEETDCSVPGCDSVTVELSYTDVQVTVTDENGTAQAQALVLGFEGDRFAGAQALTNELGQATLAMPEGGRYRVRADLYGQSFWSGEENTCRLPACTEMSVELQTPLNLAIQQAITYTYDPLNRLTAAEINTGLYFHYTYDAVGNRLEEAKKLDAALDEIVNTYAYDAGNRLASTNGVAATWDANGNLLDDGQYTYTYDTANRLISVDQGAYSATYTYNGLGDRVSQTANGVTTQYTLDLNSSLTQVLTENAPGGYGDETYLYGLARLAQVSAESTEYFVADALGSVRQLTDAGAAVTLQRSYTSLVAPPQGVWRDPAHRRDGRHQLRLHRRELRSTDRVDLSAGQVLFRRAGTLYQPGYLGGDANLPLSYNRWAYAYDNPIKYIDPSGLTSIVNWYDYQTKLYQWGYNVDIVHGNRTIGFNQKALGKESLLMIIRNFKRDPSDIHCYDVRLTMEVESLGETSLSPNRYDWLFYGWADYWNWRAEESHIPIGYRLTPDFLKAVAYGETSMGTRTDTPGTQHLMNVILNDINRLRNVAGDGDANGQRGVYKKIAWLKTAAKQGMANYNGNPNDLNNLYHVDLNKLVPWGFIDIGWGDLNNRAIEIGAYGRIAYALTLSMYNDREEKGKTFTDDEYIDKVLHGLNSDSEDPEEVKAFRDNVRDLAKDGTWKGTRLWVP